MPRGGTRVMMPYSQRNKSDKTLPAGVCKFVRRRELRSGKRAGYLVYSVRYTRHGKHSVREFVCGRVGNFSPATERERRSEALQFRRKWEEGVHRRRLRI